MSDGTTSAIWHTDSVLPTSPVWTRGATISGVFETIRATMTAGSVLIYTPNAGAGTWTHTFAIGTDLSTWAPVGGASAGSFSAGAGWLDGGSDGPDTGGNYHRYVNIAKFFTATITDVSFKFNLTKGFYFTNDPALIIAEQGFVFLNSENNSSMSSGSNQTFSWSGSPTAVTVLQLTIESSIATTSGALSGAATLTEITISGTGTDPFGGGGSAGSAVRLTTDYGATFAAEVPVGTAAVGATGFDVARSSGNSFGAADGIVARATTIGGSYSSYLTLTGGVQAACIIVPYYKWAGALNTSATNPDIIVGLTGPDGSSRTLLWIEGGATAGTVHDLSPVAGFSVDNPNAITCQYQHHIAVFGKVSGVYHLYTTNNKSTWVDRGATAAPHFIRTRRSDTSAAISGSNKGQLYLAQNNVVDYSSFWAAGSGSPPDDNMWPRIMPDSGIVGLEPIG